MAGVLRTLGLKATGGNYRYIDSKIKLLGLDTTHFTGQLWSKGKTAEEDVRIKRNGLSDEEVFVKNSPLAGHSGSKLFNRLMRMGWENKCSECGITEWLGKPLKLHIDHKDGDRTNNELSNLRILCPNCHQQTDTWGSSKRA